MNRDTAPGPAEDREESSARPQAREEECAQLRAELAEAQGASWRKDAEELRDELRRPPRRQLSPPRRSNCASQFSVSGFCA